MGCGLEHLSNCHGEITGLICVLSAGSLWLRMKYYSIRSWLTSSDSNKKESDQ
jgi:hypothetical protein